MPIIILSRVLSLAYSPASVSASSPHGIDFSKFDTTDLAIASVLYNHLLSPRRLTPKHIAALRIYPSIHDESLSSTVADVDIIRSETLKLIRLANTYEEYLNNRTEEQRVTRNGKPIEDLEALGWEQSENLTAYEFGRCFRAWLFMKVLKYEGEAVQRQLLLNAWAAFEKLPEQLKREVGLPSSEGEVEKLVGDGVNEWEMQ